MDKVLLKTTVELRTIENVIKTNEAIRNALYDQKRANKRNKDEVARLSEQIKKQDKVLQELRGRRLELQDKDAKTSFEIATVLSMVYVACDVMDEFVWQLKELVNKHCCVGSDYGFIDKLTEAKNTIASISNGFINENLCVHNSYNALSESTCKAIADAVKTEFERIINT